MNTHVYEINKTNKNAGEVSNLEQAGRSPSLLCGKVWELSFYKLQAEEFNKHIIYVIYMTVYL